MINSFPVRIPTPWNSGGCHRRPQEPPQPPSFQCPTANLSKQGQRFLSSLAVTRDSKTADRLISKFVASSPQFIALNALSHLLSPDTSHPRLSSSIAFSVSKSSAASLRKTMIFPAEASTSTKAFHEEST